MLAKRSPIRSIYRLFVGSSQRDSRSRTTAQRWRAAPANGPRGGCEPFRVCWVLHQAFTAITGRIARMFTGGQRGTGRQPYESPLQLSNVFYADLAIRVTYRDRHTSGATFAGINSVSCETSRFRH